MRKREVFGLKVSFIERELSSCKAAAVVLRNTLSNQETAKLIATG